MRTTASLADLFLKHAISLVLLVGLSLGVFSAVILPVLDATR
jgi:hypothetical protein